MLERFNEFLWGVPVLGLILGTGIWLSWQTGFVQLRMLPQACRAFWKRLRSRDSGFRALCTALAATVGTGNIAGVAGAIAIGGPGAVFWMWVSGFFGMAVKYAESTLAVRFREPDGRAGPMYIIRNGLGRGWAILGYGYCLFGLAASFGVGNAAQINAVMSALDLAGGENLRVPVSLLLAAAVAAMVMGGARAIGSTAEALVPVVSGAYILLCFLSLALGWERMGFAIRSIFTGAFDPEAVTGGMLGGMMTTVRIGVSRGTFTNEAGMGTAAIAHGSAETNHPTEQGLMGIMEVFLDTMVICTLTALVILTGGISIPWGKAAGAELTAQALANRLGDWICSVLCGCLVLFALATILGWSFYAGRCAEYLFGRVSWRAFGICQGIAVLLGAALDTGMVWTLAEIVNALMAVPNLVAILALSGELRRLTGKQPVCYNLSHRDHTKRGTYHERKGNRRDPAAHPPGSQQYDGHLRLLRQRGQGDHQQVPSSHRHDAGK